LFIITMTMVGNKLELGLYYYLGLLVAALLAGYQLYLIRNREPEKCFKAFLNNHWSGAIIFAGLVLHYWMMVPEPT
jgi:4-hydroxybenzoate polyprenyltransferase